MNSDRQLFAEVRSTVLSACRNRLARINRRNLIATGKPKRKLNDREVYELSEIFVEWFQE